jgi:hypothetical protein
METPLNKLLLTTALALGLATTAHAGDITYDTYTFTGLGSDGLPSIHILQPTDITGGAGPITLWDKGKVVVADAWCMDLQSYLAGSATVGVLPFTVANADLPLPGLPNTPGLDPALSISQLQAISWLVYLGDKETNNVLRGAFQVAIWAEEYGPPDFSYASTGIAGFDADVSADITTAGADALKGKGFAPINLNFLVPGVDATSQTLVFGSSVPEPSTWVMGGMGFAMLAGLGLYRTRKTPIAIEV